MFYGWASPSVATSQFVCRGVGLTEPERSSLWNLSDVSTLDKAGLNLAPRYVATSVHDGDSVRTIISEIIDGRRMRYLVDGSNLIWIGEETPEMHIRVDTLCYTSALLPFGDVSIPLSLLYRSNVIRSDGTLVQSATYYPYGEPHRDPAASATIGIAGPDLPMSATASASSNSATASTFSNPYLYGGKEYVRRDGLREYVYGARMSVPSVTRFNSMDKHAENYPSFSTYAFCMCNPIVYVDPTGNDVYVYDSQGYLLYQKKDKEKDVVQVRNDNGIIDESPEMKYGTIQSIDKFQGEGSSWYNVMKVRDDKNGRIIHEFLASHTKVEWVRILVGKGRYTANYITTSNEVGTERAGVLWFNRKLRRRYHIREWIHNHYNSPEPSDWDGDYIVAYALECILGYHIIHKILFFEKDANSNTTPTYYEYSPTDEPPTQEAIDKYGILPK